MTMRGLWIFCSLLLLASPGGAQDIDEDAPVKTIEIGQMPYYDGTLGRSDRIQVRVHEKYDRLLESSRREDIEKVRDAILADPGLITPMTMMVLAIRLYDVGLRDESVFWFYVAKARYVTYLEVLNLRTGVIFDPVKDGMNGFWRLAGPVINGYAFCDVPKQIATLDRALDWVDAHPYQALFVEQFPAQPGDRAENLRKSIAKQRQWAKEEHDQLSDPAQLKSMQETRAANHMDRKFCW